MLFCVPTIVDFYDLQTSMVKHFFVNSNLNLKIKKSFKSIDFFDKRYLKCFKYEHNMQD